MARIVLKEYLFRRIGADNQVVTAEGRCRRPVLDGGKYLQGLVSTVTIAGLFSVTWPSAIFFLNIDLIQSC